MKAINVSLVGVGGQGIILTANLLAETAAIAGMDVKKSEIHGMAQRGGSVISSVRFGTVVHSPIIPEGASDILVAFDRLEALRWAHFLAKDGKVLLNNRRYVAETTFLTRGDLLTSQRDAASRIAQEFARQIVDDVTAFPYEK